jgi:hypothetical protein
VQAAGVVTAQVVPLQQAPVWKQVAGVQIVPAPWKLPPAARHKACVVLVHEEGEPLLQQAPGVVPPQSPTIW